jgi:carboxymethylenebutenolidase
MAGEIIEFASNGGTDQGYLARAEGGGPGVVVIQEWWGLVPHITEVADRFAAAGFTALAPDLYRGRSTTEPDEAGKLMMALNLDQAAKDMSGAVDRLLADDAVTSEHVGVIGFCMGGGLALRVACARPDAVSAVAPFYGLLPWPGSQPDWSLLAASVRGHYAENDGFFGPAAVAELQGTLDAAGKDAVLTVHPGTDHAFFNDTRPEVYDAAAAAEAWDATISFFRDAIA